MNLIVGILMILASYTGEMRSEPIAVSGGYRLQITGAMQDVAAVCSQMDCTQVFATPIDAANAFAQAWGAVNGVQVEPIPAGNISASTSAKVCSDDNPVMGLQLIGDLFIYTELSTCQR